MHEIERKFLVKNSRYKALAFERKYTIQAYLNTHPERSVRIRIQEQKAWITVKGKSDEKGLSRFEWEQSIAVADAEKLLKICEPGKIEKYRYYVKFEGQVFEVDEFLGENSGLVVAEAELENINQPLALPDWIGEEVTGNKAYYNASLMKLPFINW
ncbi:CYTH domain-containing protein [Mesonia sp. HuA40]|uniref:CYTH domain-containing protein n=1 Tax=Mesonia sp. HuA40 TaxID=2602761 RepID=UPI0011C7EA7E|nr:CYTH domain-containing protein [Mesonia sp. HuA40]TXK72597.1 CYTH domain-containing protein [Mesonia sp. HuA40]